MPPTNNYEAVYGWAGFAVFLLILLYAGTLVFGTHEYMKAIAIGVMGIYTEMWVKRING